MDGGFYMLYTVDDIARMLNMHSRTIRRYIEKGQLRAERIGGSWRISEEALAEMFDGPELKDTISKHISERTEDMLEQYLKGKHRLQQNHLVALYVFVFDPKKEPWVLAKSSEWMAKLNDGPFDFTMTGSENGLHRITIIATHEFLQTIAAELEQLRPPQI